MALKDCLGICLLWLCSVSVSAAVLLEPRIIGGNDLQDPPNYLVLLVVEAADGQQLCGGSYIGDRRVLTAAHCLFGNRSMAASNVQMYFNVPQGNLQNLHQADRIDSSAYSVYPQYNDASFASDPTGDAAVIYLPQAVPAGVQPILLAGSDQTEAALTARQQATALGWGVSRLDEPTEASNQLQSVSLTLDSPASCAAISFCSLFQGPYVLFAGSVDDGKDACSGDSGGPLVLRDAGVPLLLGLTSFGPANGCARDGVPGGFTRVSAIREWALNVEPEYLTIDEAVIAKRAVVGEGNIAVVWLALLAAFTAFRCRVHHRRARS